MGVANDIFVKSTKALGLFNKEKTSKAYGSLHIDAWDYAVIVSRGDIPTKMLYLCGVSNFNAI